MSTSNNPFIFGKVVDKNNFCDRHSEVNRFRSYINKNNSLWLCLPRGYGKTSFIKEALDDLDNKIIIDINSYNITSIDSFCRVYSEETANAIFDLYLDDQESLNLIKKVFSPFLPLAAVNEDGDLQFSLQKPEMTSEDLNVLLTTPEQLFNETGSEVVIVFDEFQELKLTDTFDFKFLAKIVKDQSFCAYIFVGGKATFFEEVFVSKKGPLYRTASKFKLAPLSLSDVQSFVRKKFWNSSIEVNDEQINKVIEYAEGSPHYVQYLSSILFDKLQTLEYDDKENIFDEVLADAIINKSDIIINLYDQLNVNQRNVLTAIALLEDDEELFSYRMKEKYSLPVSSTLTTVIQSLSRKDLIIKSKTRYSIINPIFKYWLIQMTKTKMVIK